MPPTPRRPERPRIAVAGASGLIGRAMVEQLQDDPAIGTIHALLRTGGRQPALPPRVKALPVDYGRLGQSGAPRLPPLDWALCALGTTIKVAGSQAAFRAVDVDAVIAFARAAKAAGATRFAVVSALGADAKSRVFYNRCKGEMEAALRTLGFKRLVIVRPSLLLGDRDALGQPGRGGERLAQRLAPVLAWVVPKRLQPIEANVVAAAMLRCIAKADPGTIVLESEQLRALGGGP